MLAQRESVACALLENHRVDLPFCLRNWMPATEKFPQAPSNQGPSHHVRYKMLIQITSPSRAESRGSDVISENYGSKRRVVSGTHGYTEAAAGPWSGGICEGGGEALQAGDCFGVRRRQIEVTLQGTPIEKDFPVIVSANDVAIGQPDPAIYEM